MSAAALARPGRGRKPSSLVMPDYRGGGIVNLMSSIAQSLGADEPLYPALRALPPERLSTRNVVLLVVDGLGHDYLIAQRPDGALARATKGRITSVFPSTTAAAVTCFFTGLAPQQHGVTGWFTYFSEVGGVLAVLPYQPRAGGPQPTISANELFDHAPLFDRLQAQSHVIVPDRIVHSAFNEAHRGAARLHGFSTLAEMLATITALVRESGPRRYVYAYWPELDRLAHEHGVESASVRAHLDELDAAFAGFLEAIAGADATVIVTSDHGFIDRRADQTIDVASHPQLAATLRGPLCGERRAAYCYVHANRRAAFLDYVARFEPYAEVKRSEELIEEGWFGLGAPHPRLHERIGDYALIMKERAIIKDATPGEKPHEQVGVHGGASPDEMYVPLIVVRA